MEKILVGRVSLYIEYVFAFLAVYCPRNLQHGSLSWWHYVFFGERA